MLIKQYNVRGLIFGVL